MAKESISKTNAARLLDQLGIRYELRSYEVDPEDLAAETVAAKIGLPPEQVFKTLVARPSGSKDRSGNGVVMAVIPGDQELDLKALASAAGEKKIELVPVKELQGLTGYIRGGVTALAAKRDFPVYVDRDYRTVRRGFRLGWHSRVADSDRSSGLSSRDQRNGCGPWATEAEMSSSLLRIWIEMAGHHEDLDA